MQLLVVQIIVIQKSGKFTGNLLVIFIMHSIRPGENETSGITASFCFFFKRATFFARKCFLTDLGEKDVLLAGKKRKPLD